VSASTAKVAGDTTARVSKVQAAIRQLDVAIELLLEGRDPLAVLTLSAAAFRVFSDFVEHSKPGGSWREKLIVDSGLERRQALNVLNRASNFLKHADLDAHDVLDFDERENDHLIFFATIECAELGQTLSYTMQAVQVWYLACNPNNLRGTRPSQSSSELLPGMGYLSRGQQLSRGLNFVMNARTHLEQRRK
jgi:hypothetical protein